MTSRLSSLLVQDGLVSAKRMADAFQRQVIYGGTLDTNLLEMRVVEEDVLLSYLGRASGLPTQPAGLKALGKPSAEVLKVFAKDLAERFRAVPCDRIDGGVLRVLVADPVEPQDMEALAQSLRLRIEPWIGPEFRLMEAMDLVFGEALPSRFSRLLSRSNLAHEQKGLPPPRVIDPVPRFGGAREIVEAPAPAPPTASVVARIAAPIASAPILAPPSRTALDMAWTEEATAVEDTAVLEERIIRSEPATPPAPPPRAPVPAKRSSAEPVPELIPEESAPVVPVRMAISAQPAPIEKPAPAPIEKPAALPPAPELPPAPVVQAALPMVLPPPPVVIAAPAPAPVQPPAQGGGKKKKRRRGHEAPRVPPAAPIVAKPVITPPVRAAEMPLVVREPSVVIADLPSGVGSEQRTAVLTSEHTPLPSPLPPSSDLSGPLSSLVSGVHPTSEGRVADPVPVPIDSGRLGEQIGRGRAAVSGPTPLLRVAVAIGEPRPSSLSFEAARELIAGAEERDLIFETLCRAVRGSVAFAAVFTVHGDVAFGRCALGDAWLDRQGLGKVAVPLDRPSAFRIAVKGRSPHLGRMGEQPAAGDAISALGRTPPLFGGVLPVLVRGRTLALLYLDDDGREIRSDLLEELRPLMIEVSQAFQRLVLRSRAGGFSGTGAEEGQRAQVENEMIAPNTGAWRAGEHDKPQKRSRSTLARFSAHSGPQAAPQVIEVRDEARAGATESGEGIPKESTEQPTTRLRPEGGRRSQSDSSPGLSSLPVAKTPAPGESRQAAAPSSDALRPVMSSLPTLSDLVVRAALGDEQATEQLLGEGESAARAVVMALPGPLRSRERQALGDPIGEPVFVRGALLSLLPRLGTAAVQPLLERLENPVTPPEVRYYVALCFTELPLDEAIRPLGRRLFDSDDAVRMAAVTALRNCPAGAELRDLLETLRSDLLGPDARRQQHAAEALGELRDVQAVSRLIQLLSHEDVLLANAAVRALQTITKQDFGRSRWRWRMWWRRHQAEPRLQWMLNGLAHQSVALRASSQDELRGLCGDVAGYRFDQPRRERDLAQRRWVHWWQARGYPVYPT